MNASDMAENMDAVSIRDPMGGANQSGVRDHNERLVLSLIQRHGGLPSADIARRSNLSAQTVSIIIRALEKDGLLVRGEPIRGKVGKPSTPMALNPDGILSLGLNIGRKSADLVLIDVTGTTRAYVQTNLCLSDARRDQGLPARRVRGAHRRPSSAPEGQARRDRRRRALRALELARRGERAEGRDEPVARFRHRRGGGSGDRPQGERAERRDRRLHRRACLRTGAGIR